MVKAAVMTGFNEPSVIESLTLKPPRADAVVVRVVCHSGLNDVSSAFAAIEKGEVARSVIVYG